MADKQPDSERRPTQTHKQTAKTNEDGPHRELLRPSAEQRQRTLKHLAELERQAAEDEEGIF